MPEYKVVQVKDCDPHERILVFLGGKAAARRQAKRRNAAGQGLPRVWGLPSTHYAKWPRMWGVVWR